MFFFDPIYFVFVAPGFLLAALATILNQIYLCQILERSIQQEGNRCAGS